MTSDVAGGPKGTLPETRPSYDKSTKVRDPGGATPGNPDPRCDYVEVNQGGMLDGGNGGDGGVAPQPGATWPKD